MFGARRWSVATASFGCDADTGPAQCVQTRARRASKAEAAVDELLALSPPDRVDAFAVFRLAAVHLPQHSPDGPVRLFANVTGRHDRDDLAFDEPGLADRVDAVVAAVEWADLMPTRCRGWQVHLITPSSGDPAHDRARTEVVRRLLESCVGELATSRQHRPTRRPEPDALATPQRPSLGDGAPPRRAATTSGGRPHRGRVNRPRCDRGRSRQAVAPAEADTTVLRPRPTCSTSSRS